MKNPPASLNRSLASLIVLLALALVACQAVYQAAGLLPTPTPTRTHTPRPTLTATQTPLPTGGLVATRPPVVYRNTPFPTHPLITLEVSGTPIPLDMQLAVFRDVWETVRDNYLYPDFNGLDWDAVYLDYKARIEAGLTNAEFYAAVDDMINRLGDDHSNYLSPEALAQYLEEYQSGYDYAGIGTIVAIIPERQRTVILCVFPGSPAEAAGLRPRDSILAANGESILTEDGTIKRIIPGPAGTEVTITVQTPGEEPRTLTLVRQMISSHAPVPHTVLTSPLGKRIGYIFLFTFSDSNIDEEFGKALEALSTEAPLDGLIIDNTYNGGGADTVLLPILSYLVSGTLGNFISHEGERPFIVRNPVDIAGSQELPLVVLVGPGTVSYGEVMSGVLQDLGRAYLIGETTDGNVETMWGYDFEDGSHLWLAHESFRPLRHPDANWEETGIIPDLEIPIRWDEYTVENDPLNLAAMAYLDGIAP